MLCFDVRPVVPSDIWKKKFEPGAGVGRGVNLPSSSLVAIELGATVPFPQPSRPSLIRDHSTPLCSNARVLGCTCHPGWVDTRRPTVP
jgi:hypothetical protein